MLAKEEDFRNQAVLDAAKEIMLAVRTAPKTRGWDNIEIFIADGAEQEMIAAKLDEISEKTGARPSFPRDAKGVRAACAVLLIGVKKAVYGLNCTWCGFESCEKKQAHPEIPCVFAPIDLGIAAGVAAARMTDKFIDNRMMFSIGVAVLELGWFDKDVGMVLGFPLCVSGKNPLFDRK